eukprot:7362662-Lingulodinium_polyedra.AAC.1
MGRASDERQEHGFAAVRCFVGNAKAAARAPVRRRVRFPGGGDWDAGVDLEAVGLQDRARVV